MSRSVLLSLLICAILFLSFTFVNNYLQESHYSGEKMTIIVNKNDTLWEIARKYKNNKNIRKSIHKIKQVNNLSSPVIYPGQKLVIPSEL